MENEKMTECPQVRYHITYDNNLTFKDLEDLLKLVRMSNNDIFQEMGISRSEGNDLQKIESIHPGSINIFAILKMILSVGMDSLAEKLMDRIRNRIKQKIESCAQNPTADKPVYCKYKVDVRVNGQTISVESTAPIINIEIEIHNGEDKYYITF